jgi:hypothetical protein
VPALRAALGVYRRQGRSAREVVGLLAPLTMAGYYSDHRLSDEHGDETNTLFARLLGLDVAARLRPLVGRHLSMMLVLAVVAAGYVLRHGRAGVPRLREDIMIYIACLVTQVGKASICLDAQAARRLADKLEPLAVFGSDHATTYAHRFALLAAAAPEDRVTEVVAGCREILRRLEDPRPVPDMAPQARLVLHGGVHFALGVLEVFYDSRAALEHAEKLDSLGLELYEMAADQVRTSYHACRGEMRDAEAYRQRVERRAVQAGTAWQVEVWAPASMTMVHALVGDSIGLKRCAEQLDRLARDIPSLRRPAAIARSEYLHLKGDHEAAFAIAGPLLESTTQREFIGRAFCLATRARALNHLGRHQEAKAVAEAVIAGMTEADRDVVTIYESAFVELAQAEAGLGSVDRARAILDERLDRHGRSDHPLLLGGLHGAAAAIAMRAGDTVRAKAHLAQMERWFRPTDTPALVSRCERLQRDLQRLSAPLSHGGADDPEEGAVTTASTLLDRDPPGHDTGRPG